MAFDFSTLITDRSPEDLQALRDLLATPMADWTAEQLAEFNQAASKGAYNYTDLNRVIAAMDDINERLTAAGYETGYHPIIVHPEPPPDPPKPTPILPNGYTQLEYIESSGTQYFDTKVLPNQETRVTMEAEILSQDTTYIGLFGVRDQASQTAANKFILWSASFGTQLRSDWFGGGANQTVAFNTVGIRLNCDKNKNICTVNDAEMTNAAATGQCTLPLFLLAINNGAKGAEYMGDMRLYSCTIYEGETIIHQYIPCRAWSGDVGLYDLKADEFLGNAGTGVFAEGPVVVDPTPPDIELPDGYKLLQYIQSSGNSYINTGFTQNNNSRVVMDVRAVSISAFAWAFEGRSAEFDGRHGVLFYYGGTDNWNFDFDAQRIPYPEIPENAILHIDYNKNVCEINGVTKSASPSEFSCPVPTVLLACNSNGTISGYLSAKLHSCKIYDDGELVRNYVPVIASDGTVGLYDLVGQQFYSNAGSGNFSAGPEIIIPAPKPPEPVREPELWYEDDIPRSYQMSRYLQNVAALRGVLTLPENTAEVPAGMAGLTLAEANAVEEILLAIEDYLTALASVFRRCGASICGGPGFYFKN